MRILQPAEWTKPRGFSHGVEVVGPGRWIVLAGQTGGDEKGEYQSDMAAQVGNALRRIIKLLGEAGAGPEHIVRLTWYLTSRSEYEAAGAGRDAANGCFFVIASTHALRLTAMITGAMMIENSSNLGHVGPYDECRFGPKLTLTALDL
jgi:enamine deaminase RidA (YjgF/YER057c/UK114 family)